MAACAVVVENGTEVREVAEWSESEDGGAVMCERIRQTRPNAEAVAADRARGGLRRVAEAIEQVLDIEAALERYGWPRR